MSHTNTPARPLQHTVGRRRNGRQVARRLLRHSQAPAHHGASYATHTHTQANARRRCFAPVRPSSRARRRTSVSRRWLTGSSSSLTLMPRSSTRTSSQALSAREFTGRGGREGAMADRWMWSVIGAGRMLSCGAGHPSTQQRLVPGQACSSREQIGLRGAGWVGVERRRAACTRGAAFPPPHVPTACWRCHVPPTHCQGGRRCRTGWWTEAASPCRHTARGRSRGVTACEGAQTKCLQVAGVTCPYVVLTTAMAAVLRSVPPSCSHRMPAGEAPSSGRGMEGPRRDGWHVPHTVARKQERRRGRRSGGRGGRPFIASATCSRCTRLLTCHNRCRWPSGPFPSPE